MSRPVAGFLECTQAEQAARKKAEELLKASELREKQATAAFEAQAADRSALEADRATLAKERRDLEQMQSDIVDELRRVRSELQAAQHALNGDYPIHLPHISVWLSQYLTSASSKHLQPGAHPQKAGQGWLMPLVKEGGKGGRLIALFMLTICHSVTCKQACWQTGAIQDISRKSWSTSMDQGCRQKHAATKSC